MNTLVRWLLHSHSAIALIACAISFIGGAHIVADGYLQPGLFIAFNAVLWSMAVFTIMLDLNEVAIREKQS